MKSKNYLFLSYMVFLFGICPLNATTNSQESSNNANEVHAQLSSSNTQISESASLVTMENIDGVSGLQIVNNNEIIIKHAGTYFITVDGQIGDKGFLRPGNVYLWLVHNNTIIANTAVNKPIIQWRSQGNISTHAVLSLRAGDTLSVGFSATAPGLGLVAKQINEAELAVPSIIFSIFKTN